MADGLVVGVLGPVTVRAADDTETTLRGHAAHLVAWLALTGRSWTVDALAERMWPDGPPATARTVIQGVVSRLRKVLDDGPVRIETVPDGYRLRSDEPDPTCSPVDIRRFRALVDRAPADPDANHARAAVGLLTEALSLWRGPALAGARDTAALADQAAALDGERAAAETMLAEALVAADEIDRALALLGRLLNDDPLDERRWALVMIGLTRSGRQTEALRAYRRAVDVLADRTGLEPGPELRRLETSILLQDPSLDAARWRPPSGAAPPITSVVGRADERTAIAARLRSTRLVTLVGPGGVGKSTLALDVAASLTPAPTDGAVVVDLAACGADDVAPAVAQALGGPASPELDPDPLARAAELSARREVLVVLDGCEHVQEAAGATAAALLRAGPGPRVLATSQTPLGVAGEAVVPIAPLAPPPAGADIEAIRTAPAAQLLARRLEELGLPLADDDWPQVASIARTLDGLPLAIEVAAAGARVQPLAALARSLAGDSSTVLDAEPLAGSGRRVPLRRALDAACARLDPSTARLYAVVSAFPGWFDAAGAAAAAGITEAEASASLARLAHASLVAVDPDARDRLRLLQPVRAHAAARLEGGDRRAVDERLVAWALDLASDLGRRGRSPDQVAAVARFNAELPTLRSVLRNLVDTGDIARAAVVFADLVTCWVDSESHAEALVWADELLEHADRLEPGARATLEVAAVHAQYAFELIAAKLDVAEKALKRADDAGDGFARAAAQVQVAIGLGWRNLDLDRAEALTDASRAAFLAAGERYWAALVLEIRGLLALRRLDIATGIATLEAAAAEHRAHGSPADVAHALTFIGYARRAVSDLAGARRAFDEAARVLGPVRVGTWLRATIGSGHASLALGELDLATATFRRAHDRAVEVGDQRIVGTALVGLAQVARATGDLERTVGLLAAAADAALAGGDATDAVTAAGLLGELLVAAGSDDEAAVLLGATELVPDEVTVRVDFGLAHDVAPLREELSRRLGADRVADLARDGRVIGLRASVRRAIDRLLGEAPEPVDPAGRRSGSARASPAAGPGLDAADPSA